MSLIHGVIPSTDFFSDLDRFRARKNMENVDDGVIYIDVMSWLLSPSQGGCKEDDDQDERMLENLCQLIIHIRPSLVDQLIMAILHSPRLWSIGVRGTANRDVVVDKDKSGDDSTKKKAIEPFLSIFLKLKFACSTKFHRSSLPQHSNLSTFPVLTGPDDAHQNRLQLKPSTTKFIERWRAVVVGGADENSRAGQFSYFDLRQLCLMAALLISIKSFDLTSASLRLQSLIERDCIKFIKRSIHQTQSATSNVQLVTSFDPDSVITWLAVQIIPSITPINLAESETNDINYHLAKSLFRVFENGHLFNHLSTSLDLAPHSVNLRPQSTTDEVLKNISNDVLAQIVLSISLSISRLIEHTTKTSDLKSFSADLTSLADLTEEIHGSWLTATRSYDQVHLPEFKENSISTKENQTDRWLKNIFFSCLLILGGLVNKLAIRGFSNSMAEAILSPAFRILSQVHFITLRFSSDKLSTHAAVFDTLATLLKPHPGLANLILKECQPSLMDPHDVRDPVRISRVVFYFNLIERLTGSVIQEEYLEQTVVPLVWAFINRAQVGFYAHLALLSVLEFCSKDIVMSLANKYFEILIHDISLDQSSVLSFDQQKVAWKNLLKSVSKHSRSKTEELTSKLIESIKMLDPPVRMIRPAVENGPKNDKTINDQSHNHQNDQRKKLYKLLICEIGELNYDETEEETTKFLDTCWDLIRFQEDLVELFEVGLNQQSFKISNSQLSNPGVRWWLQKTKKINSSAASAKL
ncbi:hypothetical protein PGT21_015351 [Puccinia graminis f. sp. tritici]|uniref:Uncharacterized protein n=2 Tax=Puccinia graminis f. sp. tritici TaxID=56615 RepID=A0A5B0MCE1_PUCGR|nr:hypothetical protein PGT21_015351 [Puccinia graminis f. sp. tritici]